MQRQVENKTLKRSNRLHTLVIFMNICLCFDADIFISQCDFHKIEASLSVFLCLFLGALLASRVWDLNPLSLFLFSLEWYSVWYYLAELALFLLILKLCGLFCSSLQCSEKSVCLNCYYISNIFPIEFPFPRMHYIAFSYT